MLAIFHRFGDKLVVALFLVIIAAVVPLDAVLEWKGVKLPARAPFPKVGAIKEAEIVDGRAGPKFEQRLMNHSYFVRWTTAHYNELVYRTTRRTTPASWVGQDKWLFIPQRVREFRAEHWRDLIQYDVAAIDLVNQEVAERGAHLVVALVPDRARIYPDKAYAGGQMPTGKAAFLPALAAELRQRGIAVVDLTAALTKLRAEGTEPFYPDDHHWTSRGAERAVKAVVAGLSPELREMVRGQEPQPRFRARWNPKANSGASLTRKLGFVPDGALENEFRRVAPRVRFSGSKAKGWDQCCATYWSTSYGMWGSPQFFANEVRCPVRLVMKAGRGSSLGPLSDLPALRKRPQLDGDHLIVWEIPEYHLVDRYGTLPSAFEKIHRYFAQRGPGGRR